MDGSQTSTLSSGSTPNLTTPILPQNHPSSIKLTENNYLVWRQQILATVRGYGLESFLTGKTAPPEEWICEDGSSEERLNPEFSAWNRQDQLLSAWIQSSLSECTMVIVFGLSAAYEIWQALETNFASQSRAKLMQYKLQL